MKYLECYIVNDWNDHPKKTYTFEYDEDENGQINGRTRGFAAVGRRNNMVKIIIVNETKKPYFKCKPIVLLLDNQER